MCRSVLNDTWVSVPTGSEDFSFKNMRKNQYEEALFKCEDDRYEIDMVIDSNFATIHVLEGLSKEIEALGAEASKDATAADSGASDGKIPKWRYRFDKRTLGVVHLKTIARVYGDHGTEILELLRKNPAGAVPVVLARLKRSNSLSWNASGIPTP